VNYKAQKLLYSWYIKQKTKTNTQCKKNSSDRDRLKAIAQTIAGSHDTELFYLLALPGQSMAKILYVQFEE